MINEVDANAFLSPYEVVEHEGLDELELANVVNKDESREQNIDTYIGKGVPHVGMQFLADKAWEFYNTYEERQGFSIHKSTSVKGKDGAISQNLYAITRRFQKFK